LVPAILWAQDSTSVKTDISNQWQSFNPRSKTYRTLKPNENASSLRLRLAKKDIVDSYLEIISQDNPMILINGEVIGFVKDTFLLNLDDLNRKYTLTHYELTLYSKNGIRTRLLQTWKVQHHQLDIPNKIEFRERSSFFNNFIISALFIISFFAFLLNKFPKDSADYAQIFNSLSFINRDEVLITSRPLGRNNLLFIALNALLLGLLLVALYYLSPQDFRISIYFSESFILEWIIVSVIIFGLIILKYLLISAFSRLFVLGEYNNIQFLNGLRYSIGVSFLFFIVLTFSYLTIRTGELAIYTFIIYSVIILLLIRIIILFFKLMNYSKYKTIHLIIYLCATEIIPFLLMYKIVMG